MVLVKEETMKPQIRTLGVIGATVVTAGLAHDMTLHVPVQYADGTNSVLDLAVTGDFRD